MKIAIPLADTEQSLFYSAINALRVSGQGKVADDLDQRMENLGQGAVQAAEIGGHILAVVGEAVVSVEPTSDSVYLETETGQVYTVSIMRCEE
jgi:hypothetical protein